MKSIQIENGLFINIEEISSFEDKMDCNGNCIYFTMKNGKEHVSWPFESEDKIDTQLEKWGLI